MFEARELTKLYNNKTALNKVSFTINKGEIFCLLGANGAGKTTLINLFLNFIAPTSGNALIDGLDVEKEASQTKKIVSYIPEVVMLYSNLTGIENLKFFSRIAGFRYTNDELSYFLSKAGLQSEAFKKKISGYSKGMRQKVGIAVALAKDAKGLLMDEPTSGLDPKASNEFTGLVKELASEGRAVFMVTHDLFNSVNVGNRIGIIKEGNLLHTVEASTLNALQLQELYLQTIN